jgi:hypothetical protein
MHVRSEQEQANNVLLSEIFSILNVSVCVHRFHDKCQDHHITTSINKTTARSVHFFTSLVYVLP